MMYFDASALVKRYVREPGTEAVRRLLRRGDSATCRLSEAEISSAFARRQREGTLTPTQRQRALAALRADLERLHVIELTEAVVTSVHALLEKHPLRAGDALQLASALALRAALGSDVVVVAYDVRLHAAARVEGLSVRPRSLRRQQPR